MRSIRSLLIRCFLSLWILAGHAIGQTLPAQATGCVIYREYPWYEDSQALLTEFSTCKSFPSVTNIVTVSGQPKRIPSGLKPFIIPYPADTTIPVEQAKIVITQARKRFPQFASKFDAIEAAWAKAQAGQGQVEAVKPTPEPPVSMRHSTPLRTKSGEIFYEWAILRIEGRNVVLSHSSGLRVIGIQDLPESVVQSDSRLSSIPLQDSTPTPGPSMR